ncbi:MAG: phosphodiester glycosidase family protein [Cyanobacteria bacterium J06641_5]
MFLARPLSHGTIAFGILLGIALASPSLAARQGDRVQVGGIAAATGAGGADAPQPVSVPWQQQRDRGVAVADTAAWQWLGLELLATGRDPQVQPVRWFGEVLQLPVIQADEYRYLNLEPLLARAGSQIAIEDDRTARIQPPATQIRDLRLGRRAEGWRVVLELDRPLFWQQRLTGKQATLEFPATLSPVARTALAALTAATDSDREGDRPTLMATTDSGTTQLQLSLPDGLGLQATTLAGPYRLVLDLRRDPLVERTIQWRPGLNWQQRYLSLDGDRFAVTWLEIDAKQARQLRPFWAGERDFETLQIPGLAPLRQMARPRHLTVAINGGFFNRNNQFPLGALRRDGRWRSSPILNRGAVAWDDRGEFYFGRGRFFEVFQATGRRWPGIFLNSGYIQPGLARYTPDWGAAYTPASDGETVVTVAGDRVVQQATAAATDAAISIPRDGYVLAVRKVPQVEAAFTPGARIAIEQGTIPTELQQFPQVLGAGPLLLQAGRTVLDAAAENFSKAFVQQAAPRSAIARDREGNVLLVAFGDRVGGRGPTLNEMAQLLQQLGSTDALNLDGGSSASLYLGGELINRPPATSARVHNGLGF